MALRIVQPTRLAEPDGLSVEATTRDFLIGAQLHDAVEVGLVAEEQVVGQSLAGNVFNLSAAEVKRAGKRSGIGQAELGQKGFPDVGLGLDARLVR